MVTHLITQVGTPYEKYDAFGVSQGCMAPIFKLYPHIPHYDWPADESQLGPYMEELFHKHSKPVSINEMQIGDVLLLRLIINGLLHPGVYIGDNKILHCSLPDGWQIMRINIARIKGVYRVCQD